MRCKILKPHTYTDLNLRDVAHGPFSTGTGFGTIVKEHKGYYLIDIEGTKSSENYHNISKTLRLYYKTSFVELINNEIPIVLW